MNMTAVAVLVGIAVAGLLLFVALSRKGPDRAKRLSKPEAAVRHTAPSVRSDSRGKAEAEKTRDGAMLMPGPDCCWCVRQLVDTWFARGEIPELPLDACDRIEACKCHYRQLPDRRVKPRRTQVDRRNDIRFETKSDRRGGEDRRRGEDSWKISV